MLNPGSNCWRVERADRLAFLIDADDYFRALYQAMRQARHSIYILSWDINSRLKLIRHPEDGGNSVQLDEFLNELARERPDLNIYILNWDFVMIFAPAREFLPIYNMDWKTHRRVHFCLDDQHPEGASHHQKVVVIDDCLAFNGGLDLTLGRWDTSDHQAENLARDRLDDAICNPYHDIQVMFDGEAAKAMAELARARWKHATGKQLIVPVDSQAAIWPDEVQVDIRHAEVGIARTRGEHKELDEIREIQQLHIDAIATAERHIYIENQYLTAPSIRDALKQALEKENGPEILIILPRETDGWLSQYTMDVLRVRLIRKLMEADHQKRLRVMFPDGPDLQSRPINVHAKIMVVDDHIAMVGSANLNNRSMGLDSECNVVIEGDRQEIREGITAFRNRLLAEHMGCSTNLTSDAFSSEASLLQTVKQLNQSDHRYLSDLPLNLPPEIDRLIPETDIVDPEHPIRPELILPRLLPKKEQSPARERILYWLLLIIALVALAAMWRWTPMHEWLTPEVMAGLLDTVRQLPAAPLWVILGFVIAGLIAFPFSLLIIATVAAFGPLEGLTYSLLGGMLSAMLLYALGEMLGRNVVRQLAGEKLNSISHTLARHGIITVIIVRIVPVAPFTVINLVAGASHINFRDYIIGTLLGMTPGMVAIILVADRVYAMIEQPDITNIAALIITVLAVITGGYHLVKWLKRRSQKPSSDQDHG